MGEDKSELTAYVAEYFAGILDVLGSLPRPMVLAMKANDCLRNTASRLEVAPSVPLAVTCRACCGALEAAGDKDRGGWRSRLLAWRCGLFLAASQPRFFSKGWRAYFAGT